MNCQNSKMNNGIYKMNSESSASSVSSSDNTFLNFVNLPCATPFLNNQINRNSVHLGRSDQIELNNPEILGNISVAANKTEVANTSIPNSCSLIFSTAASFNINQQVSFNFYNFLFILLFRKKTIFIMLIIIFGTYIFKITYR